MKKYIIFQPSPLIASLCNSMLDTTCYHEEVRVKTSSQGRTKIITGAGWEVTLQQLRQIHQHALSHGFSSEMKVAEEQKNSKILKFIKKTVWNVAAKKRQKSRRMVRQVLRSRIFGFVYRAEEA